jgi:uncharacterized protein (TIGR02246 family)
MAPIRTTASEEDVEVAICRLSEEWASLWNAGQLERVVDLYTADALYLPAHANPIHGRKHILEFLGEPMRKGATDFTKRIDFIQRAGNLAYDVGHYSVQMPQPDGSKKLDQGRYLVVWQRQESGEWRMLVFAAQSSEEPWQQKPPSR